MLVVEPRPDGRRLRAVRTRAAIVEALYDLVRDGDPAPTAATIAKRAGVALRSIGQHFPSRETLLAAVAEHHLAAVGTPPELITEGPRAVRIRSFVRARAEDLERTIPMRRAIAAMPAPSEAIRSQLAVVLERRRAELARVFAAELEAHPADARRRLLDRLDLVSSGPAWDLLRQQQGHAPRSAATELATLLAAVLA
jgi:AcrR family transcriptional regulator